MSVPNVPKIQRGKPKPFKRNSIDVIRSDKREWQNIKVRHLEPGDIVADIGKIESILFNSPWALIENVVGREIQISLYGTVFAYVRVNG